MTKAFENAYEAQTKRLNDIRSQIFNLQKTEMAHRAARCTLVAEHLGFSLGCAVKVTGGYSHLGKTGEVTGFLPGYNLPKTVRVLVRLRNKNGDLGEKWGEFDSGNLERIENLSPGAK